MGSRKNSQKEKVQKSKAAERMIKMKQLQKKKAEQARIKEIEKIEQEKQIREQERQERIKSKREERIEFIASYLENGKTRNHDQRVDAQIADEKRREAYLKHVNYQPKLEEEYYQGK